MFQFFFIIFYWNITYILFFNFLSHLFEWRKILLKIQENIWIRKSGHQRIRYQNICSHKHIYCPTFSLIFFHFFPLSVCVYINIYIYIYTHTHTRILLDTFNTCTWIFKEKTKKYTFTELKNLVIKK